MPKLLSDAELEIKKRHVTSLFEINTAEETAHTEHKGELKNTGTDL